MSAHLARARPSDAALIVAFVRELAVYEKLAHEAVIDEASIARALFCDLPRAFCDIAEWSGEPAGFAIWFYSYSTFTGRHGVYLEDLFVRADFRGRGLGKALLRRLAQRCLEEDLTRLEWSVLDWNKPSIDFYTKLEARVRSTTGPAFGSRARRCASWRIRASITRALPCRRHGPQPRHRSRRQDALAACRAISSASAALTMGKPLSWAAGPFCRSAGPAGTRDHRLDARSASRPRRRPCGPLAAGGAGARRRPAAAMGADAVMVVGGAEIYAQTIGLADRLHLTEIDAAPEGDARFPAVDSADFELIAGNPMPLSRRTSMRSPSSIIAAGRRRPLLALTNPPTHHFRLDCEPGMARSRAKGFAGKEQGCPGAIRAEGRQRPLGRSAQGSGTVGSGPQGPQGGGGRGRPTSRIFSGAARTSSRISFPAAAAADRRPRRRAAGARRARHLDAYRVLHRPTQRGRPQPRLRPLRRHDLPGLNYNWPAPIGSVVKPRSPKSRPWRSACAPPPIARAGPVRRSMRRSC